ncbi:MAG TPA: hypothetical protein VM901_11665 [Bdellovibrionota bacterium]|jgi:hypothetical protein|nr:hypothetical protein [Bdellovibrionota bacterium]
MELELHPFEHSSTTKLFEVRAEWHLTDDNVLHLHSTVTGPVHFLDYDRSSAPEAKDELWKKTCFEFFALKRNSTEYVEWNYSPGGDYQRYRFSAYRERLEGSPAPLATDAKIDWKITGESLDVRVAVPLPYEIQKIQICWVMKVKSDVPSYWALGHTSSKPDFHNVDAFHQCGA